MDSLPTEVIRRILSSATLVNSALDTRSTHTPKDELDEISRSMATKRSLSLVSKLVHDLTDEYLFEMIRVTDDQTARSLAVLLREDVPGKPSRGWWCRRLEIDLPYPADGRSWQRGAFTLWGLVPACPRLADLRCHVEYNLGRAREPYLHVSDTLLKLIASNLARTLHRLEFTGQVITAFEDVESMLLSLDQLESCRILGLRTHNRFDPAPVYDPYGSVSRRMTGDPLVTREDARESEEYEVARMQASWPSLHDGAQAPATPILPRLRTLHLSHFTSAISKWRMPSLVDIGIGFPYWIHTPGGRTGEVKKAVLDNLPSIARLTTYCGRGEGTDIWSLLSAVPSIEFLEYHVSFRNVQSDLFASLSALHTIKIYRNKFNTSGHTLVLIKVYDYRQRGFLPALEKIYVTGSKVRSETLDASNSLVRLFTAMGVSVESSVTKPLWVVDNV